MAFIDKIAGIFTSSAIKPVADILDKYIYTSSEREAAKLEVQKALDAHNEKMMAHAVELARVAQMDQDSARDMQKAALLQADLFSKRFIYYLAALHLAGSFVFFICLFFYVPPAENKSLIEMIAGALVVGGAASILKFFFSSSVNSQVKDETIQNLSKK